MAESACPFVEQLPSVMSNFDHTIESDIAARLEVEEAFSTYPGWNFNGRVWRDREANVWKCEVWTYGTPREVIEADTLEHLMARVSDEYGYE